MSSPDSENGEIVRKHHLAECEKCPYGNKGGFVPTLNITPAAKVAVVGEAPGAYEASYGVPFTGPSGKLLDEVLNHHNLNRADVMITNSVLCRPDNNDDPPKSALAACAHRLHTELAEGGVETIIAVGKAAAHALLDDNKSTMRKLRVGGPKPYKENHAVNVVATWHPAYCLRTPDAFPDFVTDIEKVRGWKERVWVEPQIWVYDDPIIAARAVRELGRRYDRFVLDIECGVEKDNSFVHPSEYPLLCLGIAFEEKKAVVLGENAINSPEVRDALREVLPRVKIGAHNGKFDLAGLRNVVGRQELWFDTMYGSYSLDERPGHHGLKVRSIEDLGAPDYEQAIKVYVPRGGNYANIPREILYKYNAYDVVCTWDIDKFQESKFNDDDRKKRDFLIKLANAVIDLEMAGIKFDLIYNKELHTTFETELEEIERELSDIAGYDINPRSVPQVMGYYAAHGLILPTTDKDFLKELMEKIDGPALEFTEKLLHHRKRAKLYGTYVKGLAKRVSHGKIYTTYLLHGTTSGRLSSREPNLQNVTREKYIRNQFTAEHEDNVLVQLDYSQAEGRVIATLAQDEYLATIFRDDSRDIFNEFCNDIFGVGRWGKEQRVTMKSIFYGNAYGREAASIAKALHLDHGLEISVQETASMMREFNNLIPGVVAWQSAIKHKVLSGDDLTTPWGRRRSFWLITEKNRKDVLNEALSYLPQSIASDICATALINVMPKLDGIATMRLTIHDALVFETHKDRVEEAAAIVRKEMLDAATAFTTYVPFKVDLSQGFRWGEL